MKTAISIPDELFKEVERFAQKHNYSRSEVFVIAVKAFLRKIESKKLLNILNDVYSTTEPIEEKNIREKSKRHYARTV
jgi:metal-responsive CopG/Arc/MetJ family transcriptional regulator